MRLYPDPNKDGCQADMTYLPAGFLQYVLCTIDYISMVMSFLIPRLGDAVYL